MAASFLRGICDDSLGDMAGTSDIVSRVLGAALVLVAGLTAAVAAEPVRGQSRELGISFELAGESDWCNPTVVVELSSDRASVYQPEAVPFLKMMGRIRAIINDQCPRSNASCTRALRATRKFSPSR